MHRHGPGCCVSYRSNSDVIYLRPQHVLPSSLQTRCPGGAIHLLSPSPSSSPTFVPGTQAMLPGAAHTRAISSSFVLCLGRGGGRGEAGGGRDLQPPVPFYHLCNKKPDSFPEEPPERFADVLCTQNDPLMLPPPPSKPLQKGALRWSPRLAPPGLRCQDLPSLGRGGGDH